MGCVVPIIPLEVFSLVFKVFLSFSNPRNMLYFIHEITGIEIRGVTVRAKNKMGKPIKLNKKCLVAIASIMIISSSIAAWDWISGEQISYFDLIYSSFIFLVAVYLLWQAKNLRAPTEQDVGKKTMSLELFALSCLLGLFITAYSLNQGGISESILLFSLSATTIFALIIGLVMRKRGYLRSRLLREK